MKIVYIFLICTAFLYIECTPDTEAPSQEHTEVFKNLLGIWHIQSIVRNGNKHVLSSCEKTAELQFQNDKTFRMQDKIQLDKACISTPTEGTWSATPTELSMTIIGDLGEVEVYRNLYEFEDDALRIYKNSSESEKSDIYVYTR